MFKKIIIAVDLSTESYVLTNCLSGLKTYGTQECLVLMCLSIQQSTSVALSYANEVIEDTLAHLKDSVEKQGFTADTRIIVGNAKHEINKIAEEEDYSLIIVGAEQDSMLKSHLFGGIGFDVISFAKKPVLLIRINENFRNGEICVESVGCDIGNHILFPTDFSENADIAFDFLEKMVIDGAKKITLLHIQDKSKIIPHLEYKLAEFDRIDSERLESMKKKLERYGDAKITTLIRLGTPAIEIINLVKELNVQLVVLGSQGRGFVEELFIGSVSNTVARKSDASVLLVPARREI